MNGVRKAVYTNDLAQIERSTWNIMKKITLIKRSKINSRFFEFYS